MNWCGRSNRASRGASRRYLTAEDARLAVYDGALALEVLEPVIRFSGIAFNQYWLKLEESKRDWCLNSDVDKP